MQKNLWNQLAEYVKNNRFRSAWKRVVLVLACVVVFCTTYALILPAITMEQKSYCGYEEHVHTKDCYQQIPVASELICPLVEGEAVEAIFTVSDGDGETLEKSSETLQPHTHTEECYAVPKEPPLTCDVAEGEEHQHEFLCYGSWELTCTKEEHTHTLGCFADTQADVESYSVWENMIENMDLAGIWAEDVVTIAKSQMGYTESARNYIVNEDTTVSGYTRYGAWGNAPYDAWDAMFASFCLYYGGVEGMPLGEDANTWKKELAEANLYRTAEGREPQSGNLLFMDEDLDGTADHVALVSEYIAEEGAVAQIKTVQGDVSDQVQYVIYEADDAHILGYGILPKQPDPVLTYTYSDETLQVDVELPEGSSVPKDAVLAVTAIEESSEKYAELLSQAEAAVTESVVKAQFYDISFYTAQQEYVSVSEKAKVIMRFREEMVDPNANTVVLHYDENDSAPVVLEDINVEEQMVTAATTFTLSEASVETTNTVVSYETEGFSVFAVVEVEATTAAEDSAELITNLDGEIVMIVAVNNDNNGETGENFYWAQTWAVNSQEGDAGYFGGSEVASTIENQLVKSIETTDPNNNLAWEFEAVPDSPGQYYIRVANFHGTTNNNAGEYIYFYHQGEGGNQDWQRHIRLGDVNQRRAFEVVRGQYNEGNYVREMVCLRTFMDGRYRYIQLGQNRSGWPFYNSANFGEDDEHQNLGSPNNHFVLAKLSNDTEEGSVVNRLNEILDQMPGNYEEYIAATEPEGSTFTQQVAYRENLRRLAMEAMELCNENPDALTDLQKNFIGQERFEKLMDIKTDAEWLWRKNPSVVDNDVVLDATISLFNYDANVNNVSLATQEQNPFTFYDYTDLNVDNQDNYKTVNGIGDLDGEYTVPQMNSQLVNGYPYIENSGSLQYLFDTNSAYHQGTMTDGGGLFQKDADGYYYYYSDKNAAWYNPATQRFELYDVAVYPEFIRPQYNKADSDTDEAHGNFYPFNPILEGDADDVSNVIYDGGTVTSRLDNQETQTAFLNEKVDLWFGMSIEYDFFIPEGAKVETPSGEKKDMVFEFHGDDDVFVYIDDVLVLDLGGTHTARNGSINFTTGLVTWEETVVTEETVDENVILTKNYVTRTKNLSEFFTDSNTGINTNIDGNTLADYTMHNLQFYYMERGGTYSYAGIRFNMPALPENALLVRKELTADAEVSYIDAQLDYTFKVVKVDDQGYATNESLFPAGTSFEIRGSDTEESSTGTVKEDGTFTIKAGQVAIFPDLVNTVNGETKFVVQEVFPDKVNGQYHVSYTADETAKIELNTSSSGNTHGVRDDIPSGGYTAYQTDVYSINDEDANFAQIITYTNDVDETKLDTLTISKLAGINEEIDPNQEFRIRVMVGGASDKLNLLPTGTGYTVSPGDTSEMVGEDGIIRLKVGETATIQGFLAGTYWKVEEVLEDNERFVPVYSSDSLDVSGQSGHFGVNDTVNFTITNYPCDFLLNIPISKQAIGNAAEDLFSFEFDVEQGTFDENTGVWTAVEDKNGTTITVTGDEIGNGSIVIGMMDEDADPTYFKISEQKGTGDFIYDEDYYIVKVDISDTGDGKVGTVENIWKNGTENLYTAQVPTFVNYKSTTLTVEKEVLNTSNGEDHSGSFSFEVRVQLDGVDFLEIPSGSGYTVDNNGTVRFTLNHNQSVVISVPINATVTVVETDNAGYQTRYQVQRDGNNGELQSGTQTTISGVTTPVSVHYTNQTCYELPATGGRGIRGYIWSGWLMIFVAAGLFLSRRKAKK